MFPHAMGGLALPALNFHAAYGIPPKKDEKKKDPPPEDDAPFTYDYYGRPMALQDDMSQAKLYMHQVLNCPYPWVDEYVQRQVKLLMDSA
jgi:hypothetical protein